jgi:hypothetical protein
LQLPGLTSNRFDPTLKPASNGSVAFLAFFGTELEAEHFLGPGWVNCQHGQNHHPVTKLTVANVEIDPVTIKDPPVFG